MLSPGSVLEGEMEQQKSKGKKQCWISGYLSHFHSTSQLIQEIGARAGCARAQTELFMWARDRVSALFSKVPEPW